MEDLYYHLEQLDCDFWLAEVEEPKETLLPSNIQNFIPYFLKIQTEILEKYEISYQIFHTNYCFSIDQLKMVLHHLERGFQNNFNISKQKSIDFLLYLSQQRQIQIAIQKVGISEPENVNLKFKFGEILFGNPKNIKRAREFLFSVFPKNIHHDLKFLEIDNWDDIFDKYNLSPDSLVPIFQSYQMHYSPESQKLCDLVPIYAKERIEKGIVDGLNQKMVELFIQNVKNR